MLLTEEEIYKLHQKHSRGEYEKVLLELVWIHSKIVEEIGILVADNLEKKYGIKANRELIKIGALLHDIGSYDCYPFRENVPPYIRHGEIGYEILINEGITPELARFSAVHIGVGITKENIEENSLPLKNIDYIPISLEEEIVAFSDNFHSKANPNFVVFDRAKINLINHYKPSKVVFERFQKKYGIPDLTEIEEKYKEWHKKMGKIVSEIKC